MTHTPVTIIGGGLAGSEAAWQLLKRGHTVHLYEMKPQRFSAAHTSERLAELVCSNSFKSNDPESAPGLLKNEMRRLDSLIVDAADRTSVPAGTALAVDRAEFSHLVEKRLLEQDRFKLIRLELGSIPREGPVIVATGPLTSDAMAQSISALLGSPYLYFYDAIAPIVEAESIDMDKVYLASRYDKGTADYLNCPLTKTEYKGFRSELLAGEKVTPRTFESTKHFEGCLPIEVLAARGEETLAFGPLKPVGLVNPYTNTLPYAVVQLRRENASGTLFNLVGFQTRLTWPEQKRIFRMIPGLENAEFARLGSIHRNTYIHSPSLLSTLLHLKASPEIYFAGQITGVEGYMESVATGLLAGLGVSFYLENKKFIPPPPSTAMGALVHYVTSPEAAKHFQPMNINFGIIDRPTDKKVRKKDRHRLIAGHACSSFTSWLGSLDAPR